MSKCTSQGRCVHVLVIQDKDKDQDNKKPHDLDIDEVKNHVGEKKKGTHMKKKKKKSHALHVKN